MTSPIVNELANYLTAIIMDMNEERSYADPYGKYYSALYYCCTTGYVSTYYGKSVTVNIESRQLLPLIQQALNIAFGRCIPSDSKMDKFKKLLCVSTYTFRYHYKDQKDEMVNEMVMKSIDLNRSCTQEDYVYLK